MVDVPAHITGTVWKVEKNVGDAVVAGDILIILESMKMRCRSRRRRTAW